MYFAVCVFLMNYSYIHIFNWGLLYDKQLFLSLLTNHKWKYRPVYPLFTVVNSPLVTLENSNNCDLFIVKSVTVGNVNFSSEHFTVACRPVKPFKQIQSAVNTRNSTCSKNIDTQETVYNKAICSQNESEDMNHGAGFLYWYM